MGSNNRRLKGLIAGAAGAILLIGGSTYALWSSSGGLNGGTITAGSLGLTAGTPSKLYDVSSDRLDSTGDPGTGTDLSTAVGDCLPSETYYGHEADLSDWNIVPGDSILEVFPFKGHLKGDNLVAKLSANFTGATSAVTDLTAISGSVTAYYLEGTDDVTRTELGSVDLQELLGSGSAGVEETLGFFQSPEQTDGTADGSLPELPDSAPASDNICVVLSATWDADSTGATAGTSTGSVTGTTDVGKSVLGLSSGISINLVQTRDGAEIDEWKASQGHQFGA
ncbi:MAG: alternate-type signal peptide domain-containing protein [Propionibacteriaceae bacterium]|jgi:alternate signal-mediated exported protein|nr:alternate-type signal peptide domain-containing protein [Propionibacteriaceae bacterium]